MRILWLDTQSPYFNLAAEEYLLHNSGEEIFMLWQNKDSVIVGRYQNTLAEVNMEYIENNDITVARRSTGGGAVFHDLGNLNFTFIRNVTPDEKKIDFRRYLSPIVEALNALGVPAEFSGRNDLTIEGRKISGNAMTFYQNRVLEHGTLLFSTIPERLVNALKVDPAKFTDKAVQSVRSRVTNISEHLPKPMSVMEFRDHIFKHILKNEQMDAIDHLTDEEKNAIEEIAKQKSSWEWNFGKSPRYEYHQKTRTKGGIIEVLMDVKEGIIQDVRFYGDFFSKNNPEEFAQLLNGQKHQKSVISSLLQQIDISQYFNNTTSEEILNLLTK
ncbi:MAG: lipoate--protein ligase [Bacteroidales bacterium]|nr:lipoate--protein ligase [Bacteroidales bacterium]